MQIRNLVVAGMVLVAVATQSCKKDEVKNVNDTLLSGTWHIHTATISPATDADGDGIPDSSGFGSVIDSCAIDDIYDFQENSVAVITEGTISCNPSNTQPDSVTWSLNADESIFTLDMLPLTVVSHTSNSVVVSSTLVVQGATFTVTFKQN